MKSQNFSYIPALDHLRGFAAILVALFHGVLFIHHRLMYDREFDDTHWLEATNLFSALIIEGHTAVSLFFVLSGFIFTFGLINTELKYFKFLKNRFLRTYPLFLAFLCFGFIFYPENLSVLGVLKSLFFMANLQTAFNGGPFTFVAWSVAIEWQFYLIFPLLLMLTKRFGVAVLFLLLLTAIGLRWLVYEDGMDMRWFGYWTLLGRIDQFLAGMIAGHFYSHHFTKGFKMDAVGLVGAALVLVSLYQFNRMGGGGLTDSVWILWPSVEGLTWAVFLVGYISLSRHLAGILDRGFVFLGKISYSIYFIHYVILFYLMINNLDATISIGGPVDTAFVNTLILVVPATVICALVSFRFIEQPFLSLRGVYLDKPPSVRD
ncbi:MAG: acyltransferase [Pseudomonadales bacterium]|jgi:peptidoglycan/LPS O-acetylase OafA/YrhL|nr:acyltransferase [Pseudomonadales bacterium]